jgi:hypothetical protein
MTWSPIGRPLLATAVIALAGCPNDIKDAHCGPDAPSRDLDPSCIYAGNGEAPVFDQPACELGDAPADCSTYVFEDVVALMADEKRANCADANCHGAAKQAGIYFDLSDPQQVYDTLTGITGSVGTPYVDPDARSGWMYCNLKGTDGGGFPQPPPSGLTNAEDADLVGSWIHCGAPGPDGN